MSATLPILQAFQQRLSEAFPDWAVDLMPDDPRSYFLSHPNGAILISYAGSKFGAPRSSAEITQTRNVHIVLTVISRNLHDDSGAVNVLDHLRLCVTGYRPPHCGRCWLTDEQFDGQYEDTGIWMYQLALVTDTMQIEQLQPGQIAPKFTQIIARAESEFLDPRLTPKGE